MIYYVLQSGFMEIGILMESVSLLLLNKICSHLNIISKIGLIQAVPIPKYFDVSETMTVFFREPLRRASTCPRFIVLTYLAQCYTTRQYVAIHEVNVMSF